MSPCTHDHTDIRTGAALKLVKDTLDGIYGDADTGDIITGLRSVVTLLGGQWDPPNDYDLGERRHQGRAAAKDMVTQAINGLYLGDTPTSLIIDDLSDALALLGWPWQPPAKDGSDGGYVPSDDDDPGKLVEEINHQLSLCQYYDGETLLDGPYKIWARAEVWYTPTGQNAVLLVAANREEQAPVVNALLHWGRTLVAADLPAYPGQGIGWHWSNVSLGDIAVVDVWVTSSGIAVQEQ